MTRNFLVFIFGLFLLLIFTFAFCYVAIYSENMISGIFAIVGFLAVIIISIAIGLASREEGGTLYVFFFAITLVSSIVFIWYLTRAGTLLQIW